MSIIGYARVSTEHQSLDQQRDALTAAGAQRILTDHACGIRDDRPGLAALLDYARTNGNVGYQNCPNAGPARRAACIAFWRPHGSWASRPAPEAH